MKPLMQSFPPLGQVTGTENNQVSFTSVLDVPRGSSQEPWEVSLWISVDDEDWREIKLVETAENVRPQPLHQGVQESVLLYFSTAFSLRKCAQFTLKFRQAGEKSWTWAHDETGLDDGIVLLQSAAPPSEHHEPSISNLNPEWAVRSRISQSPGTRLWSLQSSIPSSAGDTPAARNVNLGTPWGSFVRWFALVRHQPAWLGPRQGKSDFAIDQDAILCCFMGPQGKTMALLAVSGINNVTVTFQHSQESCIRVHARSDSLAPAPIIVLVSEGLDLAHAVASVLYEARTLVSPNATSSASQGSGAEPYGTAVSEWKADWHDGLGFCTWNALGQQFSEERLLSAVKTLADHGVHLSNLIIDDNWQSLERMGSDQSQHAWIRFEADKDSFPSGLKSLTGQIRSLHPDIEHIFVWHALLGYWGGISREGDIFKTYRTTRVSQGDHDEREITIVAKEDAGRLFDDFYSFLLDSGIDGVKTDVQVMIDSVPSAAGRRDLMSTYLDQWSKASWKHFGTKAVSCMSQFPFALFHSQLPWMSRSGCVVRNSDDYFPDEPESHTWHVWANAHNAIFTQFLSVLPDWDMFQTNHEWGEYHGAARCLSGGPIWLTDDPGSHNLRLVKQMTAVTPNGKTIVLRPSILGKTTNPYNMYEARLLLKVGSYNGPSRSGCGILGLFNVSPRRATELLPLGCFPGSVEQTEYIVRSHKTGKTIGPVSLGTPEALISVSVDVAGYDILCAFPASHFDGPRYGKGHAGVLGLLGKMTGCAAVTTSSLRQPKDATAVVECTLKALGTLGVYVSTLPRLHIKDDLMVMLDERPVPLETVQTSKVNECVVEIDVEEAWASMRSKTTQRDEVAVKVLFTI